jgi:hypothetical protein
MYEEFMDLPGFDPTKMIHPQYRMLVEQARQIKDNYDELYKKGETLEQKTRKIKEKNKNYEKQDNQENVTIVDGKDNANQLVAKSNPAQKLIHDEKPKIQDSNDFTMGDFVEQERYDANSPIYKQLNEPITEGESKPINSVWISKGQLKKYLSSKIYFKIKERGQNRIRTYRYQAIGEDEIEELRQMSEDIRGFYTLMNIEGNTYEDREGNEKPALLRNGKMYRQLSKLENDYRKKLAKMVLNISATDYPKLEQFSDPDLTVNDIWGLKDILDSILERAVSGASYFRIASKT